jgi:murein DD-endopeptidase MepM/ murein hydrolase activator NlpD
LKVVGRLALATAILFSISAGAPLRMGGLLAATALAQEAEPSPTQSDEPSPTPTPSDTPTPSPTPEPSPTASPDPSPDPSPSPSPSPSPDPDDPDKGDNKGDGNDNDKDKKDEPKDKHRKRNRDAKDEKEKKNTKAKKCIRAKRRLKKAITKEAKKRARQKRDKYCGEKDGSAEATGALPDFLDLVDAYNTDGLVAASARLTALGWSKEEAAREVFAPFIIGGKANWIDTWGAPRYGPGPIVRTHEGQDVFCDYGDPVLASENGTIEYDEGGLGGIIARLYRSDGSYWYYAHLSETNVDEYPTGTTVHPGDVIGYCGNSGNAITTPPHVHFGWYGPDGDARNTMKPLVRWLREAEKRAGIVVEQAQGKRADQIDTYLAARRFGDAFVPGLADLEDSEVSLWDMGTKSTSQALELAQGALLAMFAGEGAGPELGGTLLSPLDSTTNLTTGGRTGSTTSPAK